MALAEGMPSKKIGQTATSRCGRFPKASHSACTFRTSSRFDCFADRNCPALALQALGVLFSPQSSKSGMKEAVFYRETLGGIRAATGYSPVCMDPAIGAADASTQLALNAFDRFLRGCRFGVRRDDNSVSVRGRRDLAQSRYGWKGGSSELSFG